MSPTECPSRDSVPAPATAPPLHGLALNVLVEVDADYFHRDFFARTRGQSVLSRQLLDRARARIADSPYILFARQIPLTPGE